MYYSGRPDESKVMSVQVISIKGLPGPDADGHKGREDGGAGTQRGIVWRGTLAGDSKTC